MPDPVLSRRGRVNSLRRYRPADDPVVIQAERELSATRTAEYLRTEVRNTADVDAWAQDVAAALEPFTPDEAAAVGRLGAVLSARVQVGHVATGEATA